MASYMSRYLRHFPCRYSFNKRRNNIMEDHTATSGITGMEIERGDRRIV
jgi:hypothetical protein